MINLIDFKQKWNFLAEHQVYVACSGGVDSMVLIFLLQQLSIKLHILHVNYHLRNEESDTDENFIKNYCIQHQLSFECLSVNLKQLLETEKGNLQQKAREIRFNFFIKFLEKPTNVLVLGHHFDDQLETFYQHIARKSGILGLACMLEKNGNIIRPLLQYRKKEIYQFAKNNALVWREDSSNQKNNYTRNKLRNEFLPFIEKKIPDVESSVRLLIQVFQENYKTIASTLEPIIKQIQNEGYLSLEEWNKFSEEQKVFICRHFGFSTSQFDELNKLLTSQKGKSIKSHSYQIIREEDSFFFKPTIQQEISCSFSQETVDLLPTFFNKNELYLDKTKIQGNLKIRPWKIGDRIAPIGLRGSKLISDVITEAKVAHSKRNTIFVLHDDEHIHWCVGLKIGRIAVANKNSQQIIKITID
jgi:tRNA(Ile)-lysidine synthase